MIFSRIEKKKNQELYHRLQKKYDLFKDYGTTINHQLHNAKTQIYYGIRDPYEKASLTQEIGCKEQEIDLIVAKMDRQFLDMMNSYSESKKRFITMTRKKIEENMEYNLNSLDDISTVLDKLSDKIIEATNAYES